jgi:hypothetical protein
MSDIVHIANNLGQVIGAGRRKADLRSELSLQVIDNLGLKPVDLEDIADETLAGVNRLADVL